MAPQRVGIAENGTGNGSLAGRSPKPRRDGLDIDVAAPPARRLGKKDFVSGAGE